MPTPDLIALQAARDQRAKEIAEGVLKDVDAMQQIRQSAADLNPGKRLSEFLPDEEHPA